MVKIVPTLGRVMWFVPFEDFQHHSGVKLYKGQRYTAHVCFVHGENSVNVMVIDSSGKSYGMTCVHVKQADAPEPKGIDYCEWMPYQVGQAGVSQLKSPFATLEEVAALRAELADLRSSCTPAVLPDVAHSHLEADLHRASDDGMTEQFSQDEDDDEVDLSSAPAPGAMGDEDEDDTDELETSEQWNKRIDESNKQ